MLSQAKHPPGARILRLAAQNDIGGSACLVSRETKQESRGLVFVPFFRETHQLGAFLWPAAERSAVPRSPRSQRRQAEALPHLSGMLHIVLTRQRYRRVGPFPCGVDQH